MTNDHANDTTREHEKKSATAWPILFRYKGPVIGSGFVADVELCGRLLVEIEADGVWLYGVNPGALAVSAPTLAQGGAEITKALTTLLVDFAEQMGTFESFKAEVERFFYETDAESESEWDDGVRAVRAGSLPSLPGLPIKSADETKLRVSVVNRPMETLTPDDNRLSVEEEKPALAAAA